MATEQAWQAAAAEPLQLRDPVDGRTLVGIGDGRPTGKGHVLRPAFLLAAVWWSRQLPCEGEDPRKIAFPDQKSTYCWRPTIRDIMN
jgi:hypothetical protein